MRFCSNCGNPVGGSPRYCAGCGAHVDPAPVNSMSGGPSAQGRRPGPRLPEARPAIWPTPPPPRPEPDPWTPRDPGTPGSEPDPWSLRHPGPPGSDPDPWSPGRHGPPPGSGTAADPWSALPTPAGHPQAGGLAGAAAPASDPLRTAPAFPSHKAPSGHRMTILAMVTTLALLATAGVATWQVSNLGSGRTSATATQHRAGGRPASRAGGAAGAGSVSGHGRAQPSSAARPSPSSRPSATPSSTAPGVVGNDVVAVSPAVLGTPQLQPVVAFLTTYFEAINSHDFPQYASLFVPSIRATMHHFGTGYATTFDSGATLTGLAATGPGGVAATVSFTSHQSPAASPDHAACDQWDITLFLKHEAGAYLIRHPRPGFPQSVRPCS